MDKFKNYKRFAVSLAAVVLVMLVATGVSIAGEQAKAAPAPAVDSTYVGSDTCATCHEEIAKGVERTPHYQMKFQSHKKDEATGCESCHGPGAAHVEGGGDKSKIFTFIGAKSEEITKRCLTCHEAKPEQRQFMRSTHNENGVSCTSCHSVHHSQVGVSAGEQAARAVFLVPRGTEGRFPEAVPPSCGRGLDQVHRLPQCARHAERSPGPVSAQSGPHLLQVPLRQTRTVRLRARARPG